MSTMKIDPRQLTYVRLIGEISHALNQALTEESQSRGLTLQQMSDTLGKHKSVVSRLMAGERNITLKSLADLAFALNRPVRISLPPR